MTKPAVGGTKPIKQPGSKTCFVCGVENDHGFRLSFYETSEETVEAKTSIPKHFQGYPGVAHGGVVTALLDEVAVRAGTCGEPEHMMVTAKIEVRFRKNVPVEQPLRLVGTLIERKPRATRAKGEILLPDGTLGAEAEAIMMDHPISGLDTEALEALGWKVYPD
ncbi:MAG TPA: PaaI family thioesterase [Anaerolineales bacterium]|nr:PaaI family thioesterase [Anaerolineales bacterium]